MPLEAAWHDQEESLLLVVVDGRWLWSEWRQCAQQIEQMIHCAPHRVDLVVDLRHGAPFDDDAVTPLLAMDALWQQHLHLTAIVTQQADALSLLQQAAEGPRGLQHRYVVVDDLTAAFAQILADRLAAPSPPPERNLRAGSASDSVGAGC